MTNLVETAVYSPGIYQLEESDVVQGGADGIDNLQAKQLANRTAWLKQQLETAQGGLAGHTAAADPHPQYASDADLTNHTGAADPHPAYWNNIRGDAKIAAAIAALVNSSPAALDTLAELATALGNDANFAATITNALALKAPLASPTFTGDPKAPTPAQFDNSTKVATMAALQRALGNRSGYVIFNSNQTLGNAAFGSVYESSGSTSLTCQLPSAEANPGGSISVYNGQSAGTLTVSSASGVFYGSNNPGGTSTVVMQFGAQMEFISDGTNWKALNGSGSASLAASGYQKLPSGLIIQWGSGSTNSGGTLTQSFPITFPNGCLQQVAVGVETTLQTTLRYISCGNISNSQITVYAIDSGVGIVLGVRWFAIGY